MYCRAACIIAPIKDRVVRTVRGLYFCAVSGNFLPGQKLFSRCSLAYVRMSLIV